jgi:hypothetical protein
MLALLAPFAAAPALLAYAIAYGGVLLLRVPLGLLFWRTLSGARGRS